jgi:hypothetical protein
MEFLYYVLYRVGSRIKSNSDPAFSALLILALFQMVNFLTLLVALNRMFFGVQIQSRENVIFFGLILAIISILLNLKFLYLRKSIIFHKFEKTSSGRVGVGLVILILYGLATYFAAYLVSPSGDAWTHWHFRYQ